MEKIKIENLSFSYPNDTKKALDDISLSINEGEFLVIFGKSGCGKSTLLKQLKPILSPNGERKGEIVFEGQDILSLSPLEQAEKIGYVFQEPDSQLVTDMVWHELSFSLESLGYSNSQIRGRISEISSYFGIETWFYEKTSSLSGGQKQLLNLASVMVSEPSIILLDEPTSQLDPISAQNLLNAIYKINRELGITIVITEHRLDKVLPLCDRAIAMEDGKILSTGTPLEIGKKLYENKNQMLHSLPTPMQIFYSKKNDSICPLTIREGREWLGDIPKLDKIKEKDENIVDKTIAFELKDVWFRYDKSLPDILKGTTLSIHNKEIYSLVGGNGSGKTTLLSVIAGFNVAYAGKIKNPYNKKIGYLPQNPQGLFIRRNVMEELYDGLGVKFPTKEQTDRLNSLIELFNLSHLLNKHPYDLSGGEAERLALLKVLLTQPEILLLDEPTKGLDTPMKIKLANILKKLSEDGTTIVIVSHDIEFCAKHSTRCGLFFDGKIVSEGFPREFFSQKSYYTTEAHKMSKGIIENAITDEDIITAIDGEIIKTDTPSTPNPIKKNEKKPEIKRSKSKKDSSKGQILSLAILLILVPLTILFGAYYLNDQKYYFISLSVILEALITFFLMFERKKPKARELVVISVICAIAVVGRTAFSFIPQFKPVVAIIIITGICFGGETGFLVGAVTGFVSNFFFGQTPLTPWQMFAFGITGLVAGIFYRRKGITKNRLLLSLFGFIITIVLYGGIMNFSMLVVARTIISLESVLLCLASGLPYDIIHGLSTGVFLLFMAVPMIRILERIKIKYGL